MQEPAAVLIHAGPIAVVPKAFPARPVCFDIANGITPDAAGHRGRRLRAYQVAHLAAHRISPFVAHFSRHAGSRTTQRRKFEWLYRQRKQEAAYNLGAAGNVDDRRAPSAHVLEEPQVRSIVPGLTG